MGAMGKIFLEEMLNQDWLATGEEPPTFLNHVLNKSYNSNIIFTMEDIEKKHEILLNKINNISLKPKRKELLKLIHSLNLNDFKEDPKSFFSNPFVKKINEEIEWCDEFYRATEEMKKIKNKNFVEEIERSLELCNPRTILDKIENYYMVLPIINIILDLIGLDNETMIKQLNEIFDMEKLNLFLYRNHDLLNENFELSEAIKRYHKSYAYKHQFEIVYVDDRKIIVKNDKGIRTTLYNDGKKYEVGKKYWL